MTNLADRTPTDIDAELAKLYSDKGRQDALLVGYMRSQERALEREEYGDYVDQLQVLIDQAHEAVETLRAQMIPLEDEYARRPWTRYWLVTNSNGHVHHTQYCDTCFDTTQFAWLTQCSGMSHEDLVELAGEKACTVCFPSAPVDTLRRASKLTTPEQEARKAEKAQRAAEKAASEVVVENYRDYGTPRTHTFKTVRGATNEIASTLGSMVGYGPTHPDFDRWQSNVTNIIAALVAKGEVENAETYYNEALAKARKKVVSEHKKFMKSPAAAQYRAEGVLDLAVDEPNYNPCKF